MNEYLSMQISVEKQKIVCVHIASYNIDIIPMNIQKCMQIFSGKAKRIYKLQGISTPNMRNIHVLVHII